MPSKQRIDLLMQERGLAPSREKARAMIMAGEVQVNGQPVSKPGSQFDTLAEITVRNKPRFVSRGGEKLAWALSNFKLNLAGRVCADVGASTGGFTDCLLQNGVEKVYAIDVGYGQIDFALRQNKRVILIERTNARYIESLPEVVNFVTIDASFISLKLLLPAVQRWLAPNAEIVALIKPQFEAGKGDVGKGGVVKDSSIHKRVLEDILSFAANIGLHIRGLTRSPIKGPAGNIEFLVWLSQGTPSAPVIDPDELIRQAIEG